MLSLQLEKQRIDFRSVDIRIIRINQGILSVLMDLFGRKHSVRKMFPCLRVFPVWMYELSYHRAPRLQLKVSVPLLDRQGLKNLLECQPVFLFRLHLGKILNLLRPIVIQIPRKLVLGLDSFAQIRYQALAGAYLLDPFPYPGEPLGTGSARNDRLLAATDKADGRPVELQLGHLPFYRHVVFLRNIGKMICRRRRQAVFREKRRDNSLFTFHNLTSLIELNHQQSKGKAIECQNAALIRQCSKF